MDCIFCKIIKGEIPSTKIFENENVYAFNDINPKAPVHILVIHKKHTKDINDTNSENAHIFSDLFLAVKDISEKQNIVEQGYRIIINNGKGAGQEVFHTHLHILSNETGLGPLLAKSE